MKSQVQTCGMCKNCRPVDYCNGDCECETRANEYIDFQVSKSDEIQWYSENNADCPFFVKIETLQQ